jgi:ABC-type transporter Mla MlaB component
MRCLDGAMTHTFEIALLHIRVDDQTVHLQFDEKVSDSLDIPIEFEEDLREFVGQQHDLITGRAIELDLGNLPAISSRQLGLVLTVRDVMKSYATVRLANVSASVRQLLALTGTERFFDE